MSQVPSKRKLFLMSKHSAILIAISLDRKICSVSASNKRQKSLLIQHRICVATFRGTRTVTSKMQMRYSSDFKKYVRNLLRRNGENKS
jgi:hypothetical protein